MGSLRILGVFTFISIAYLISVNGQKPAFKELETLTASQRTALEKLKSSVSSILPHDYMREDIYLVKWLAAQGFSARRAEQMLREALKWRKDNKLEEWEDPKFFSEFEKDYPIFIDGSDKEGRPIVESYFGDWNVRSVALRGKMKQLILYSLRGIERANAKIRTLQSQGKNVTDWILLLNMDGFNVINQACPTCLPLYLGYVSQYEKVWAYTIFRSLLVNTPESFEIVLNLIRPLMSPHTRAALKVFSSNKAEWKPYLDELIDPSEISDWFDGKKDRKP